MTKSIAIGIDLGTTNSCVAVVQNGQVEAIQNDAGHRTTPSCVAFKGELIMVGDSAHEQADTNPTNTIYSAKRMIGQRYSEIQDDLPYWSFTVKEDQEERPQIEVDFQDRKKLYRPEEISAKVLAQMKEIAETKLSNKVTDAVISVPAYFNDSQRQATKNAATMAGLNVIRIINEPTAAAIEYGLYQKASDDVWNVLVFDLGGGTFDVSVLTMEKDKYTVKATTGERRLGGDDFDQKLVEYCAKEFMQKYNSDIMSDMKARHRLLVACEKAKRTLSTQMQANVTVAYHGIEHSMQITRDVLDDLCRELFNKAMKLVEQALTEAKLTKDEINDIIVVGGSTRIPKVQKMLRSCFNNKKLNKSSNPDEVVARGAAYEAAMLHGQTTKILELTDVAPLSLGVEEIGGVMRKIIAANTQIPCSGSNQFFRVGTDDTQVTIRVFQGESIWTAENQFLGAFVLTGLPPIAEEGSDEIVVTFSIDRNGIISATAVNKSKDAKEGKITIKEPVCAVNKSDIARMIEEGDRQAALNGCRRKLENCLDDMREEMEKLTNMSKISPEDQVSFKTKADEVKDLLVNRSSATRIQYERAKEELEKLCIEIQERSQNMSLVAQLKSLFF